MPTLNVPRPMISSRREGCWACADAAARNSAARQDRKRNIGLSLRRMIYRRYRRAAAFREVSRLRLLGDLRASLRAGSGPRRGDGDQRSEEHTSELQSQFHLVCRLLLEKKKNKPN